MKTPSDNKELTHTANNSPPHIDSKTIRREPLKGRRKKTLAAVAFGFLSLPIHNLL